MKKTVALLLILVMAFSVVSCGRMGNEEKTVADESLSGEITFWHSFVQGARMEAVERAVAKFEKRYPNVKLNVETMSWADFKVRWKEGLENGNLPDISTACNMYEVEELVNAGILQPTDEVVDAIGRSRFSDNVLSELTHGEQVYGVPYYSHAYVMWYRKDLLDAKGLSVPSTWEELYEAACAVTDEGQGIYGCPVSMSPKDFMSAINLHMYVQSGGGSLLNDDLTANLTGELALEGIRYWVKMYEDCSPKETIDYTVTEQAALFYEGKTAFDFNSGFHISGVAGSREDLLESISCAPLPRMNQNDDYYSAVVSHIPLVIYKDAENVEICKRFLEFLFEEENYIDFLDSVPVGMLPSIRGISSTEQYQSNDVRKQFAEEEAVIREAMLNGMALGFEHGPNLQAGIITSSGVIESMFQDIVQNGADVETAAKAAEDELNRLFEEALK
ncbi:MAG: sugar ABC transporter substrate-binding protein [Clostridiales bacterium]|nr:sugar ABC transporter substrate-binding protein [Clostridiales bacterium]